MKKVKNYKDIQKVLTYLLLEGKFKRANEIEGSNQRVNEAIKAMHEKGLISKKDDYWVLDETKHPEVIEIKQVWSKAKILFQQEYNTNLDDKLIKEMIRENLFPVSYIEKIMESITKIKTKLNK